MKITFIQILLATTITGMSYSSPLNAQDILQEKISLSLQNTTLQDVIRRLQKDNNIKFIYSKDAINLNQVVTVDYKDKPLKEVLNQVLVVNGIDYEVLKNRIILGRADVKVKTASAPIINKADEIRVKGTVKDAKGQPLTGVSIKIKGTNTGTQSSLEGDFSLMVPPNATLVFSYVGFDTQEVPVSANMAVTLVENNQSLSEVIVVGYGTQKKGDVTTAIATVKAADFTAGPVTDAASLLKGKVAGLSISNPSGNPNDQAQIQLRGNNTINGGTGLLVIVDGVPGDLLTVAPEDIAEISVLKDGSAAAIYGVRGTNGVILITTKRASGNIINQIDYNGSLSTGKFTRIQPELTAQDYRDQIAAGTRDKSYDLGSSTNWAKAIQDQFPLTNIHNLTFRGGNNQTNYLASLSYRYLDGPIQTTFHQQITGRVDINHSVLNGKLKFNLGITQTNFNGQNMSYYDYEQVLKMNPTAPVKLANGSYYQEPNNFEYQNPLSDLYNTDRPQTSYNSKYNATITALPVEGLRIVATGSYQKNGYLNRSFDNFQNISTIRDHLNGVANIDQGQSINRYLLFTGEYSKSFGDHRFSLLAGYEYSDNNSWSTNMNNRNFPTDQFGYNNIGQGAAAKAGLLSNPESSGQSESNLISYFSRLTYNYKEKYFLTGSMRLDGSSKLYGAAQPFGRFPAISAAWRINKESFMENQTLFDDLKLRAGYGITGNPPNQSFLGVGILGYSNYVLYNGQWIQSLVPTQNPNPNLRWEEKREANLGLDFTMFKGLINGTVDVYDRRVVGLLYNYTVPSPPNLYNSTLLNVGTMDNKGVEVLINVNPIRKKDFSWTTSFTFSTNANKLVSLSNDSYKVTVPYFTTGSTADPIQTSTNIVQVGHRIGDFYGFKVVGLSSDGYWIYQEPDGSIVPYSKFNHAFGDKQVLGNGIPQYYAGWNNTFRYKNWDLSIVQRGAFDFQVLNAFQMNYLPTSVGNYNRAQTSTQKVFGTATLNKLVPLEFNSYFIENGAFWKIDNITLGYTFKELRSKYIHNPRVYFSTNNTFIITGYKGIDPEVGTTGLAPGMESRDTYPTTRTFTLGFSASF
ncbi:MAG: SusC/RagA family TonB-linked outer membrane protein [Mucilaginibacter sp.]